MHLAFATHLLEMVYKDLCHQILMCHIFVQNFPVMGGVSAIQFIRLTTLSSLACITAFNVIVVMQRVPLELDAVAG